MSSTPRRLTYANVVSTLALVVAVGGGGAAVAAGLAKNSVGSAQIKNGQVKTADLANNGVSGAKVKPDTLTGADIKESTLGTVPSATRATNVSSATVESNGTLVPAQSLSAVSATKLGTGTYEVIFDRNVRDCAYTATVGVPGIGEIIPSGDVSVTSREGETAGVFLTTYTADGNPVDRPFMLMVVC